MILQVLPVQRPFHEAVKQPSSLPIRSSRERFHDGHDGQPDADGVH